MQTYKTHWASLLIFVALGFSVLFLFALALGMSVISVVDIVTGEGSAVAEMINAFSFGFEALVLTTCAWFVFQKTTKSNLPSPPFRFPFSEWQIFAIFGIAGFSLIVGGAIAYAGISRLSWITLPLLTTLVIAPPIWLLLGIGSRGIEFGPRWRVFGVLGLSMTLAPLVMVILEIITLAFILFVAAIAITAQPDLLAKIIDIGLMLTNETDQDVVMSLLAPYIVNPWVIATTFGYVAVVVPMIEELFKPLAVWLLAKKIESPAQGFALGLLSGAAFALVESLNAGANSSAGWSFIVAARAGTSLLHITGSGLVGWGIVSAFRERKILRLFAAYFCAVLIHGVWNACAVGMGFSSLEQFPEKPEWLFAVIPAALCGMFVLGSGMFAVLIAFNKKLRK